jgi:hypothetical protein
MCLSYEARKPKTAVSRYLSRPKHDDLPKEEMKAVIYPYYFQQLFHRKKNNGEAVYGM